MGYLNSLKIVVKKMNSSELVNFFRTPLKTSLFQVAGSAVREARRAFEDQFRGLPIELVDCKNKFLATSFRYQGISRPPVELVEVGGSHLCEDSR